MSHYVIVGDIGGTNSNLAFFSISNNELKMIEKKSFQTSAYKKFEEIVGEYHSHLTKEYKVKIIDAVFAVAGNVENGRVKMTNTNHVIDPKRIVSKTLLKDVYLMNDFEALSYSIEKLPSKDLFLVNKGIKKKNENILVIGAGTGFGGSCLIYNDDDYFILPTELGHFDFSIYDEFDFELANFIRNNYDVVNVEFEDVLSGKGIERIYSFLSSKEGFVKTFSAMEISKLKKKDIIAQKTFEIFYKYYARACKNFALTYLTSGGIYIGGGIVCKNLHFDENKFMEEFLKIDNDSFKEYLYKIPITVIKNYDASLLGLANYYFKRIY